jgi:hypothetical protein
MTLAPAENFHGDAASRLANDHLSIDFLTAAGPRLVRVVLAGIDENQLAEVPDMTRDTPFGRYRFLGGHRLWHAPEAFPRSYLPDNDGLAVSELPDGGVRLTGAPEPASALRKSMELRLAPGRAAASVRHVIENRGEWPAELAPWALTMLPSGGTAILPQAAPESSPYAPNRHLQLWPYTDWNDSRLRFDNRYILIMATSKAEPVKIGAFNHAGWAGYLRNGILFRKRWTPERGRPHADGGCNVECYSGDRFIELETLGPLVQIEPGGRVTHDEEWEWFTGFPETPDVDALHAALLRLDSP